MKPTMINLLFAGVLLVGLLVRRNLLLKLLLGEAFDLTEEGWRQLTYRWIVFFIALAALNEIVWRNFQRDHVGELQGLRHPAAYGRVRDGAVRPHPAAQPR